MAKASATKPTEIEILALTTGIFRCRIIGDSPLVFNRLAMRAMKNLLMPPPGGRKSAAAKAASLKHNPPEEYRDSIIRRRGPDVVTRLVFPAVAFKKAMETAALRLPGVTKTEVGQLLWVMDGMQVNIWGVPQVYMCAIKTADAAKTADIRTRAIVPEWCCNVAMRFVEPILTGQAMANLLSAGGVIAGVGDGRQEKGTLSFGQFHIATPEEDATWDRIVAAGGRKAQDRALADPVCYDEDSEELFAWFENQMKVRKAA